MPRSGGMASPFQGRGWCEGPSQPTPEVGATAAMLLRLTQPASADDLVRYFRAHDYLVERRSDTLVHVQPLNALGAQADRERVVRDLEAWQAWNPGSEVSLVS